MPTLSWVLHDGCDIVPALSADAGALVAELRAGGVAVLDPAPSSSNVFVIYTKEYAEEEQAVRDGGSGFHRGFSITSLLKTFEQLLQTCDHIEFPDDFVPFVDAQTLESIRRFQERNTNSDSLPPEPPVFPRRHRHAVGCCRRGVYEG